MINLNTGKRDFKKLCKDFYERIETPLKARIIANKAVLNTYYTDKTGSLLGDFLENNIEALITSSLKDLTAKFSPELDKLFKKEFDPKLVPVSPLKTIIISVLFYESHDAWKAYKSATDIGSHTCPYCNRTYITTLGTDDNKFVRGDFDHYLLKSEYPYLRLSFYNLIPCCVICNRNAKHEAGMTLENNIYPFLEGFHNDTLFTYLPSDYEGLIGKGMPDIDFLYVGDSNHIKKSKANVKVFRLKEQYSIHFHELNHLIYKKRIFTESYLSDMRASYPELIKSDEEAYLLAFGKELDFVKDETQPLSKFTRDILHELDLIKTK